MTPLDHETGGGLLIGVAVDDPALRNRIEHALTSADIRCCNVGVWAMTAAEAERLQVNAVVSGRGRSAAEITKACSEARRILGDVPLVALRPESGRPGDTGLFRAGTDAIVPEGQIEAALADTVRAVCAGLVCFPKRVRVASRGCLSSREKQVLSMLILGFTNAEIGRRLYLAESTVKSHLSSAYTKLGVQSRKDAAAVILDPDGLGTGVLEIARA